ncbi:beta subunit of citrate lyase [Xylariaceae sp. FL0804]|nr:beta subunit of citrate lyase [Xylariaceae sp. FL0804]
MPAKSSSILRRSLLYVPASSPRMLEKSLGLRCDTVAYDLEDSVTPDRKADARRALGAHLGNLHTRPPSVREVAVRINAPSTPYAISDARMAARLPAVDAVVVPKVNSAADLDLVAQVLDAGEREREREGEQQPVRLLALIESARAVVDLRAICAAGGGRLSGLVFAAEDFALDLSLTRTPALTEFLYARSAVATQARAAGLESTIDLVCTAYRGDEGRARLEEECRNGRGLGFNGKQCIHPTQLEAVHRLFSPAEAEVEWAVRVLAADAKAAAGGRGAWTLDGHMVDAPVVGRARALVEKARLCDHLDVAGLEEKWRDQLPDSNPQTPIMRLSCALVAVTLAAAASAAPAAAVLSARDHPNSFRPGSPMQPAPPPSNPGGPMQPPTPSAGN